MEEMKGRLDRIHVLAIQAAGLSFNELNDHAHDNRRHDQMLSHQILSH
ncbi:MAG: hypothetical protein JXR73_18220 [Candidatus Omnitrophica bacterium]|nr:hypothetical protein [Candidatus Omnitrophota bacterium]